MNMEKKMAAGSATDAKNNLAGLQYFAHWLDSLKEVTPILDKPTNEIQFVCNWWEKVESWDQLPNTDVFERMA